jgi:Tfp pilus assembly protein PilP
MKLSIALLSLLILAMPVAKAAKPKAKPAAKAPARAAAPANDPDSVSVEEFLQKLSSIPDLNSRRDPFIAADAPFVARRDVVESDVNSSAPVLERYPLGKYEVVATLLGDQYPRALMRLPQEEKNKVLIVREKDKIGNRGGVIRKILKDGIAVVQTQRSPLGFIDKVETVVRVGVSERQQKEMDSNKKSEEIRQGVPAPLPTNLRDN